MCPGSDSIALPGESTSHRELFELEAVPGETVRASLLGGSSAAVLWLVLSVCSDFCTVLWHAIRFESMYYLSGLELAVSGCPRHLVSCGYRQFGPEGKYLFYNLLWHM